MKFLLDDTTLAVTEKMQQYPDFVAGRLDTPLSRYSDSGCTFAIDNGAFSRFDEKAFLSLLERRKGNKDHCLFVACPDVVGSARRTLEIFQHRWHNLLYHTWPIALVCQDGMENHPIPWPVISAVFIGGTTAWKMSDHAAQIVRAGKIMGAHVHVGRVNTVSRFRHFEKLGADTCDGSGVSRFDWMLESIASGEKNDIPLLG